MSHASIHSYHIFLFPFKFKEKFNPNEKWLGNEHPNTICQLYEYKTADTRFYNIAKRKSHDEKTNKRELSHLKLQDNALIVYSLLITKITLKIYQSGVGVLAFHLENTNYEPLQDILNINQFGRRTYPPFLPLDKVKDSELAEAIWLSKSEPQQMSFDTKNPFFENFETQNGLPAFIKTLLPKNFQEQISFIVHDENSADYSAKSYFYDFVHPAIFGNSSTSLSQDSVIDDRMFVICWYGNDKLARYLQSQNRHLHTDDWYRYVFIDANSPTMQNDELRAFVLESSTYTRWQKYGTFYGVSRGSFMSLTSSLETLKMPWVNAAFVPEHVRSLYYQMVELCLIQRTTILKFASRAVKLSQSIGAISDELVGELDKLNQDFIKFENELYFREITAQDQGIELYDLLQTKLDIEKEVKDLHKEIDQLYQAINNNHLKRQTADEQKKQQQENKRITLLSTALAIFSVPSLVVSFFDMGLFKNGIFSNFAIFLGLILSIIILVYWLYQYAHTELSSENQTNTSLWLRPPTGFFLFVAVFCGLPIVAYWQREHIVKADISFPADTIKVQEQSPIKGIEVIIPTDTLKLGKQKLVIPEKKIKVTLSH